MAQIRGTYNMNQNFGGPSRDTMNDPSPLDEVRKYTDKIEEFLDTISDPVKPSVFYFLSFANPAPEDPGQRA
jgi:hypothetical protein